MSKNKFLIYQVDSKYLKKLQTYLGDYRIYSKSSRPYFGPIRMDGFLLYIPLSSQVMHSNEIKLINHEYELFIKDEFGKEIGLIEFRRMIVSPIKNKYITRRKGHIKQAEWKFINADDNFNEITTKINSAVEYLYNSSPKFQKLVNWCKHPENEFPSEKQDLSCFYILFLIIVFTIIGIVCGVVFSAN